MIEPLVLVKQFRDGGDFQQVQYDYLPPHEGEGGFLSRPGQHLITLTRLIGGTAYRRTFTLTAEFCENSRVDERALIAQMYRIWRQADDAFDRFVLTEQLV